MNKHIGSRFNDFLEEKDRLAESEAVAGKRVDVSIGESVRIVRELQELRNL